MAIDELIGRERERQASFERFQTALIVFLQQITAFVETKDRAIVAAAPARGSKTQEQSLSAAARPARTSRRAAARNADAATRTSR